MTLTIDIDFRRDLGDSRDQGRRPTCLSFAASDAHRQLRQHPKPLSVEWLFYHVAKHAGTGLSCGTTISDTRTVLRALGQPEEPVWPYSSTPPAATAWHPPTTPPALMACGSAACSAVVKAICEQVEQGVPVVIGMFISTTFLSPASWTQYRSEIILGRDAGELVDTARGHALVVVGRGHIAGASVLLIRNSWGPKWAAQGHAWVYEDYLADRLAGAFVISKGEDDVLQSDEAGAHASARLG